MVGSLRGTYDIESLARFSFNPVSINIGFVFEKAGVFELVLLATRSSRVDSEVYFEGEFSCHV